MARRYRVTFEMVAVSAIQDLMQVKGAAGKVLRIIRCGWGMTDTSLPTAQGMATRCSYVPVTVTDGTGGSTPTPRAMDPGDAAASFTAKANNTTQATTTGTKVTLDESGDHLYNGYRSSWDDKSTPVIGPSETFVMELIQAPSTAVHLSGFVEVEELGG